MDSKWSHPSAFIIFHSQSKSPEENILYSREAMKILGQPTTDQGSESNSFELAALCNTWKGLIEKNIMTTRQGNDADPESISLDLFKSGSRTYMVRGHLLHSHGPGHNNSFIFTFSRIRGNRINIEKKFRESRLTRREQEIVQLILEDKSNKEIAAEINLSVNTVKSYLKLLMRKLSVTSKVGIISFFTR